MILEEQPLDSNKVIIKKNKTWREKFREVKENVTVEPVFACYVLSNILSKIATQNLNLDKACRVSKQYGDKVCNALLARQGKLYLKEELAVQQLIAGVESWKSVIQTAIPSILILFLGAWSDRTGKRKICILTPIVGEFLTCLSNILNTYFFYEFPVEVTMFFEAIFPAITGGWISIFMGSFSYVSDVSTEESRTFRIGVVNLCLTAVTPIGFALSGILLKHIGYYGVFSLSCALYFFSIMYGFFYLNDPKPLVSDNINKAKSFSIRGSFKSFFNLNNVKDTVMIVFKKGPNHRRTKSILILVLITFTHGTFNGEVTVRYLFCRYRFNWDAVKYSLFGSFLFVTHIFGGIVSISLFSRRLKWDDSVLGLISNLSKILSSLAISFARNTLEMYIATTIDTFNAPSYTALRSISSKLVPNNELGKMTSVFNLMEVLASTLFTPMYSWIYRMTIDVDVGITYYVTSALTVPNLLIFGWFFIQHRIHLRQQRHTNLEYNQVMFVDKNEKSNVTIEYELESLNKDSQL